MKAKIRNWIKAIAFVLIFFVLLFLVSYVLRPPILLSGNSEKENLLGYYAEPKDTIDMIYLGSSDVIVYWMPYNGYREAGITSFTYGRSSIQASMFAELLDEALETQSPKLVVVSMRPILYPVDTLDEVSLRSVTDTLPYTSVNRWQMIRQNRGKIVLTENETENGGTGEPDRSLFAAFPFYFDIWKYHDNWNNIDADSFNYSRLGKFASPTKGFRPGSIRAAQERNAEVAQITDKKPLNQAAESAIRDLMEKADQHGFDLLFVVPPYCESVDKRMLYNQAAEIIAEGGHSSVDFNEVYEAIGIDDAEDYYDSWHLNMLGAEKFTSYFIGYLQENYNLPDHRGDPVYAAWDAGLEQWGKIESEALEACRGSADGAD